MATRTFCDHCKNPIERRVPSHPVVLVKFDEHGGVMSAEDPREPSAVVSVALTGEYHDSCVRDQVESRLLLAGRVDGLLRAALREQFPADDGFVAVDTAGEVVAS